MHDTGSSQAIVLGASMAGLLAARVLSEQFDRVVVIERDVLPPAGEHRRGVPHGRHLHGLTKVRLVNAYMPRLHAAAAHDQALAAALVRVIGLKDRPEGLLRPDRVLRVLRANLAGIRRPAPPLADQAPATLAGRPVQPVVSAHSYLAPNRLPPRP